MILNNIMSNTGLKLHVKSTNLKPSEYHIESSVEQGIPTLTFTCLKEGDMAPSQAIAKIVAKSRFDSNENCAITLEPLSVYKTVYVGSCSHVFSDAIVSSTASLLKCPLCRTYTGWTCVKIE